MGTVGSDAAAARNELWDAIGSQLVLAEHGGAAPTLGTKWELTAVLGRGGFGLVCSARDRQLGRAAAVKLLPSGPEIASLLREARSLARLDHPSIVTVFEVDEGEAACGDRRISCGWIAMQLVEGRTLDHWLRETKPKPRTIAKLLVDVGRALAYAHDQGVLHRDLKPANIMVDGAGNPRVIDFGLALASRLPADDTPSMAWDGDADELGPRATRTGTVRGTPSYMAPEAIEGVFRPEADQYSLAVVGWEAMSGSHPWRDDGTADQRPPAGALWERAKPVLQRGISAAPSERYESVSAFCTALETATAPRRTPALIGVGIASLLAAAAAIAWASSSPPSAEPEAAGTPAAEGTCPELAAWSGRWNLGAKVAWTEYSNQLDRIRPMAVNLQPREDCSLAVDVERFQPASQKKGDRLLTQSFVVQPKRLEAASWALEFEFEFDNDNQTYKQPEFYEFKLVLDREPDADQAQLSGGYRKVQIRSKRILRSGWLLGRRDNTPALEDVAAAQHPCLARCLVTCAGDAAEQACVEGACRPRADTAGDICGPASPDFLPPYRALAEKTRLSKGDAFGGVKASGDTCEANAKRVAGEWLLWRGTGADATLTRVDVRTDGCLLRASAQPENGGARTELSGEITEMGAWMLAPAGDVPPTPSTFILLGTGPAFGIDLSEEQRPLRAFRP